MTSSAQLHAGGRLRRGIAEFLRWPLLLTAVFAAAAVVVSVLDATTGDAPVRGFVKAVVPEAGAAQFVSAVAQSMVTVSSITFSVLLVAVQQTSNSLTAVVFDQFLRRRSNQLYFGFFVGMSTFCFITVAAARQNPAPVYGAAITLILTVTALVILLLLVHGTIDQMRPQSVVRSIHELALAARRKELALLGRTRAEPSQGDDGSSRLVRVRDSGYVVSVDIHRLAKIAEAAGSDVEAVVEASLGTYLVFGDVAARLLGVRSDDRSWDEEARASFGLSDIRDVDAESGYAIDQLENIAWAAGSSARQSPQTAIAAVRALRDLLARWLIGGERDRSEWARESDSLPVVYVDGAVPRTLHSLSAVIIATAESHQAQTCADALQAFADVAGALTDHHDWAAFDQALDSALPAVTEHTEDPRLGEALRNLRDRLLERGHDASRVARTRDLLTQSNRELSPRPSDGLGGDAQSLPG